MVNVYHENSPYDSKFLRQLSTCNDSEPQAEHGANLHNFNELPKNETQCVEKIHDEIAKPFNETISGLNEHASEVQNIFCIKYCIEGHRIHHLGSEAD